MSYTVDDKVVSMEFDNRRFESNVQTTLNTLDKLKTSLNLDESAKSFLGLDKAAKKIDLSGLGDAVDSIKSRFSRMGIIGTTTLMNLTNTAVNASKRIVKSFTIDPVKTGFQEYEMQINSVQTVLANTKSKGTTLKDVNKALDELNLYADKTIYNFQEMTRNIGTFTAAGVDLKTSVSAIKGISNLAAVSGSSAEQASRAMYQLSQALAAGRVKLQDWNSVVNAGMGGQVFQDALKETARVHGIAIDDMIKKEGSFRETLQKGWLTSEILTETLSKFTGDLSEKQLKSMGYTEKQIKDIMELGKTANDAATKVKTFSQLMDTLKEAAQSGWGQTWRILIGDFEEAKKLWTGVSQTLEKIIGKSADNRNKLLKAWSEKGGREMALESLKNVFQGLMSVIKPVKEAFREIFPPMTAKRLVEITKHIKDFTSKLKLSSEQSKKLKSVFKGLFSALDIGFRLVKALVTNAAKILKHITSVGKGILHITGSFGDFVTKIRDSIKESDIFNKAFGKVVSVLQNGADKIKFFVSKIKEAFRSKELSSFVNIFDKLKNIIGKIGEKFASFFKTIGKGFHGLLQDGSFNNILKLINGGLISGILLKLNKFSTNFSSIDSIFSFLSGKVTSKLGSLKDFLTTVPKLLGDFREALSSFVQNMRASSITKIAIAIGILAASMILISTIDSDKLMGSMAGITLLITELMLALDYLEKSGNKFKKMSKVKGLMLGLAASVLILAIALKTISSLSWEELARGLVGVTALVAIMVGTITILSKSSKKVTKGLRNMIAFALAIKVLANVCKTLAELSWEELGRGLTGVAGLMASVVLFLKVLDRKKDLKGIFRMATALLILSAALKILASVCKTFSSMSWEEIGKGLAGVASLMAMIVLFLKVLNRDKDLKGIFKMGNALLLVASSIKIFASVVKSFSTINYTSLIKGLAGFAAMLGSVVLAMKLMPKGSLKTAVSLLIISSAISSMTKSISKAGGMSWEEIAKGLVAIGGAMAILAIGLKALSGTGKASVSLLVAAVAIKALGSAIKTVGSLGWMGVVIGLTGIAGALTILGVAALALKPLLGTIVALSGAMVLFGVGCLAAGAGVMALATGLTTLAAGGAAGIQAIVNVIKGVVKGIIDLIPNFVKKIGEAFVQLLDVITKAAPKIGQAAKAILLTLLDVAKNLVPKAVETLMVLVEKLLDSLIKHGPTIVDKIFDFLVGVLHQIAQRLPELVEEAMNVVFAFFKGLANSFGNIDPEALLGTLKLVGYLSLLFGELGLLGLTAPFAMAGIAAALLVATELAGVLAILGGLKQIPGLMWLIEEGGELLEALGNAIGKFIGGFVGGILEGLSDSLPAIGRKLSEFMNNLGPFIDGAKKISPDSLTGVKMIVDIVTMLTVDNILDALTSWLTGGHSLAKFAEDLVPFGEKMGEFSKAVKGKIDSAAVEAAAKAGEMLANMAKEVPNSGGLISWIVGNNDIDDFGRRLPALGEGLAKFNNKVTENGGINQDAVAAAAAAGSALAGLAKDLPSTGGVLQWLLGDPDMEKFAANLPGLGKAIADFSDELKDKKFSSDVATKGAKVGETLGNMAQKLPSSGDSLWDAIVGVPDMKKFSNNLPALGAAIGKFSSALEENGFNNDTASKAAKVGQILAALNNNIPAEGGFVQVFTGDINMEKFSANLPALGDGLAKFAGAVNTDDFKDLDTDSVVKLGEMIQGLNKTIPLVGGMREWFTGDQNIEDFGGKLASFAGKMGDFAGKVQDLNIEELIPAIEQFQKLADIAEQIKDVDGTSFAKFTSDLNAAGTTGVDAFINAFTGASDKFKTAGTQMMGDVVAGANSGTLFLTLAFTTISWSCAEAIKGYYQSFYDAGNYLVEGFAQGIRENSYKATDETKKMADGTHTTTKKALKQNSPAKVFIPIGAGVVEGFVKGIDDNIWRSNKASEYMAYGTIDNFRNALSNLDGMVDDELTSDPVIRPVLDLSDVSYGANQISSMFGSPSVGVMTNLGSISSSMNGIQNRQNNDVVSAIRDLKNSVEKSSGDTYNLNGITYDDGSAISGAVETLIRAARIERRV